MPLSATGEATGAWLALVVAVGDVCVTDDEAGVAAPVIVIPGMLVWSGVAAIVAPVEDAAAALVVDMVVVDELLPPQAARNTPDNPRPPIRALRKNCRRVNWLVITFNLPFTARTGGPWRRGIFIPRRFELHAYARCDRRRRSSVPPAASPRPIAARAAVM